MVKTGRKSLILILAALAAVAVFGCGGGGEESLTKADYVRQGNAICGKWQQARGALFGKFNKTLSPPVTKAKREKAILMILKPYEVAAQDLGELSPPDGEEAKAEAVVAAMEEAATEAKANPAALLRSSAVFEKPNELADDYGLKECKA
jgi:hypothetical protein